MPTVYRMHHPLVSRVLRIWDMRTEALCSKENVTKWKRNMDYQRLGPKSVNFWPDGVLGGNPLTHALYSLRKTLAAANARRYALQIGSANYKLSKTLSTVTKRPFPSSSIWCIGRPRNKPIWFTTNQEIWIIHKSSAYWLFQCKEEDYHLMKVTSTNVVSVQLDSWKILCITLTNMLTNSSP